MNSRDNEHAKLISNLLNNMLMDQAMSAPHRQDHNQNNTCYLSDEERDHYNKMLKLIKGKQAEQLATMLQSLKTQNSEILSRIINVHENGTGETPVIIAAQKSNPACVSVLLKFGGDIKLATHEGRTATMFADTNDDAGAMIRCLIDNGAAIDAVDNYGCTVLWQLGSCKQDISELLNEIVHRFRIDPQAKNRHSMTTALDRAKEWQAHPANIKFLSDYRVMGKHEINFEMPPARNIHHVESAHEDEQQSSAPSIQNVSSPNSDSGNFDEYQQVFIYIGKLAKKYADAAESQIRAFKNLAVINPNNPNPMLFFLTQPIAAKAEVYTTKAKTLRDYHNRLRAIIGNHLDHNKPLPAILDLGIVNHQELSIILSGNEPMLTEELVKQHKDAFDRSVDDKNGPFVPNIVDIDIHLDKGLMVIQQNHHYSPDENKYLLSLFKDEQSKFDPNNVLNIVCQEEQQAPVFGESLQKYKIKMLGDLSQVDFCQLIKVCRPYVTSEFYKTKLAEFSNINPAQSQAAEQPPLVRKNSMDNIIQRGNAVPNFFSNRNESKELTQKGKYRLMRSNQAVFQVNLKKKKVKVKDLINNNITECGRRENSSSYCLGLKVTCTENGIKLNMDPRLGIDSITFKPKKKDNTNASPNSPRLTK